MCTLYTAPNCGSFVAHALMDEARADYRLVEIDLSRQEHKSKACLKIDPMGAIPALDVGQGRIMTESAADVAVHTARTDADEVGTFQGSTGLRREYLEHLIDDTLRTNR